MRLFVRMVPYLSRCKDVNDEKTKILIVRVIKSAAIDIYRKNKGKIPIFWIQKKTG